MGVGGIDEKSKCIPGSRSGSCLGRKTPELEMFKGNLRMVPCKELMGESFIYYQIFIKHPWCARHCSRHQRYISE